MAFITNQAKEGKATLKARLTEFVSRADTLDMLVGFFCFSGVKVMADAFKERKDIHLRVLVGMEADLHMGEIVEIAVNRKDDSNDAIKAQYLGSLRKMVGSSFADKKAFHERLGIFLSMLREGRLEIRKTREPNHAKLYIFNLDDTQVGSRKYWITGSSNFSEPGLVMRDELNVQIGDFGQEEVQEYFDELWNDAVPLTESEEDRRLIVEILEERSVAADVTPFEAYYLVLKNYIEHQQSQLKELQVDDILKKAGFRKYRYQTDAVAQACTRLDAYGGVVIADVVGLGKSVIGGLVGAIRTKRGMVICPPGLMGEESGETGGWNEYLQKFRLKERGWVVRSRGRLEEILEELKRDPNFDMVIVDEAHNFRNERTESYEMLANICFGREVVLLTATPLNNRPSDLLALLRLFSSQKKSPFVVGGNLEERFDFFIRRFGCIHTLRKSLAEKTKGGAQDQGKLADKIKRLLRECGIEPLGCDFGNDEVKTRKAIDAASRRLAGQMRSVMEKVAIRRNRLDLVGDPDYSKEIATLPTVCDPKEQFFELTEEQNSFYDKVIEEYFGGKCLFHGAIYHPQAYLRDKAGVDDAQENLYKMLLGTMVQRFESSFGAFRKSVESVKRSLETSLNFTESMNCFLYSRKAMAKIMELEDEDGREEEMLKAIRSLQEKYAKSGKKIDAVSYSMTAANFRGADFKDDIRSDIKLLDSVLKEIDALRLEKNDPKARKLVEAIGEAVEGTHRDIAAEPGSPKRKVIVFSSYTDTIKHVAAWAERAFGGKVLTVTGANFGKEKALEVKRNFDASFEHAEDEYDILLATDKLSEGFNLNRAGLVVNYDIPWNPTRVIQRVGRINRIGRKVFDNLYIFNFFPSKKGEDVVAKKATAEYKMFAIHKMLGEDAKIFSADEEPTAAKLYQKLSHFGEGEEMGFYTRAKSKFAKVTRFLEKNHAETFRRIENFPGNVKTAWVGGDRQTVMLRRRGPSFFALAHRNRVDAEGSVAEISLEEALEVLECGWDTPRVPFSEEFWGAGGAVDGKDGIYEELRRYRPGESARSSNALSAEVQAIAAIGKYRAMLSGGLYDFAGEVADDIQNFGTLPTYTVGNLAKVGNMASGEDAKRMLIEILESVLRLRGADYLQRLKKQYEGESVIVTVEKQV